MCVLRVGGFMNLGQIYVQLVRRGPLADLYVNVQNLLRSCEIELLRNDAYLDRYDISRVFISRG